MMVLFGHASHYFLTSSFLAQGWIQGIGVYLFFLISGFLISYSVFQKHADRRYDFRAYFIDRFCRIYSAFLPALVFVLLLDGFVYDTPLYEWRRDYNLQTWLGNLSMLQDFPVFQVLRRVGVADNSWFVAPFGSARPFWTISIEWWIYMLFGGVVLVWLRREKKLGWPGALLLAVAAIVPTYNFIGGYDQCLTILWIAGMGASALMLRLPKLAAQRPDITAARVRRTALITAVAAFVAIVGRLFATRFETQELQLGLFLATLIFALFFLLGTVSFRIPFVLERSIEFVAGYSYSLYLTHHTLVDFLAIHYPTRRGSPAMFWLAVAAANLLAVIFWYLFERHYRQLASFAKLRFAKGRDGLAGATVPGALPGP